MSCCLWTALLLHQDMCWGTLCLLLVQVLVHLCWSSHPLHWQLGRRRTWVFASIVVCCASASVVILCAYRKGGGIAGIIGQSESEFIFFCDASSLSCVSLSSSCTYLSFSHVSLSSSCVSLMTYVSIYHPPSIVHESPSSSESTLIYIYIKLVPFMIVVCQECSTPLHVLY